MQEHLLELLAEVEVEYKVSPLSARFLQDFGS